MVVQFHPFGVRRPDVLSDQVHVLRAQSSRAVPDWSTVEPGASLQKVADAFDLHEPRALLMWWSWTNRSGLTIRCGGPCALLLQGRDPRDDVDEGLSPRLSLLTLRR